MDGISVFISIGLSFAIVFLTKRLIGFGFSRPISVAPVALLLIFTIELFYGWLYNSQEILAYPHLVRVNSPMLYLVGPALYLFILSHAHPERRWLKTDLLHIIPFAMAIGYLMPFYFSSPEFKIQYIKDMYSELGFDSFLLGGTRRIHQGFYLSFSIFLLINESKSLRIQRTIRPAQMIVVAFAILWAVSIYRFLFSFDLLSAIFDTILLSLLAIYLVYDQLSARKPRSTNTMVDEELIEESIRKIERLMTEDRVFTNPDFTIKNLADQLNTTVPVMSSIINRGMDSNFNEMINKYKVEEAIRLLQMVETSHLTIEAIAKQAGFNSSSAFNDNFKKRTGHSPKTYRL